MKNNKYNTHKTHTKQKENQKIYNYLDVENEQQNIHTYLNG